MEIPKKMIVSGELERNLIFKSLQKMKEPLNITVDGIEYQGLVDRFDAATITMKMLSPVIGDIEGNNRINFVFNNNYHYFNADIAQLDEDRVLVHLPEKIYKNILRKYERIDVRDTASMKFKIMIQSEKKDLEQSPLVDERVIFQEVKKMRPSIEKLLQGIRNLVSEFSQNFQVKVFKGGEKLSFEEEIIKETRKALLIYDSYEDTISEKRFYEEQLLTIGGVYEFYISRGEARTAIEGRLLDLLQQKRNNRIYSEVYVPLMLEGEAVGYLRLSNDVDYHRSIKPTFVERATKYAGILVEALVKYDYFSLESGKDFDIPLVNISAGGLLFTLGKPNLTQYLIIQTILQMSIRFPARLIEARGVIFRIDEDRSEYGVKFQEINEIDVQYIESLVEKKRKSAHA
jgi:hypothetical protein